MKNFIKNKDFWFPKKLYEIRKKKSRQICSSQEDIQIYFRALFYRTSSFCFNCIKRFKNEKFYLSPILG